MLSLRKRERESCVIFAFKKTICIVLPNVRKLVTRKYNLQSNHTQRKLTQRKERKRSLIYSED
jgi:hypothetical protein